MLQLPKMAVKVGSQSGDDELSAAKITLAVKRMTQRRRERIFIMAQISIIFTGLNIICLLKIESNTVQSDYLFLVWNLQTF